MVEGLEWIHQLASRSVLGDANEPGDNPHYKRSLSLNFGRPWKRRAKPVKIVHVPNVNEPVPEGDPNVTHPPRFIRRTIVPTNDMGAEEEAQL